MQKQHIAFFFFGGVSVGWPFKQIFGITNDTKWTGLPCNMPVHLFTATLTHLRQPHMLIHTLLFCVYCNIIGPTVP